MLTAQGVTKRYQGNTVLHPTDLTLSPGEAVGVCGANGSGKSTLLSILAGTRQPDGGSLMENGVSVLGSRRFFRSSVGYVPQGDCLVPELTVRQQLACWQVLTGRKADRALMELLGLDELLPKQIARLSGGQRKRVSFALALSAAPRYLIMDEAFAALDGERRAGIEGWLRSHVEQGGAVLWCSHEPEEVERLCSRVITLDAGRIVSGERTSG